MRKSITSLLVPLILFAGLTVKVSAQQPPDSVDAEIANAPVDLTLAATAGPGSPVNVSTASGCAWTTTSNAPWITVTSGAPNFSPVRSYVIDPATAAARELEEETGLRAGSWRKLGEFFSAPGFTDELMHLYLATDLSPASDDGRLGPDEDERLILEWRPWRDAVAAAESGEIRDAKSIVGLFWLGRVLATP